MLSALLVCVLEMLYFYHLKIKKLTCDASLIWIYILFFKTWCPNLADHSYDVGIECDTLMPFLIETVYWTGIYFAPTNFTEKQGNSSLENADIVNAFEGIKAVKKAPDLLNVTIRDGASGLLVKELENHLEVMNTNILRSVLAGANIESSGGHVVVENTTVQSTRFGDGFVYNRSLDRMDLCSIVPNKAPIPIALKATGRAFMVNCSKVRIRYESLFAISDCFYHQTTEMFMLIRLNRNTSFALVCNKGDSLFIVTKRLS